MSEAIVFQPKAIWRASSLDRRKLIVTIAVSLIGLLCLLCVTVTAKAASGINGFISELLGDMFQYMSGTQVQECENILLGTDSGFYEAVIGPGSIGQTVSNALKGVGFLLVIVYSIQALLKELYRGRADWEMWGNMILKIVIAITVIVFSDTVVDKISEVGKNLVELLSDTLLNFSVAEEMQNLANSLKEGGSAFNIALGFWTGLVRAVEVFIPYIIIKFLDLTIKISSYSLFFELAIRRAFMPIALANVVADGPTSPGVQYLKKFFGIYVKMFIILFTLVISWKLVFTTLEVRGMTDGGVLLESMLGSKTSFTQSSGFLAIFDAICLTSAARSIIGAASNYADDVMGIVGHR